MSKCSLYLIELMRGGRHKSNIPSKKCKVATIVNSMKKDLMLYRRKTVYRGDKSVDEERPDERW